MSCPKATGGVAVFDGDKQILRQLRRLPRTPTESRTPLRAVQKGRQVLRHGRRQRHGAKFPIDAGRRFGLGIRIEAGEATISDLRGAEPLGRRLIPEGASAIPEGEWTTDGKRECWGAENGELTLKSGGGRYLRSAKEYGNFTLSFECLMEKGGNSGMGIRTPKGGWPSGDGMEIQIYDHPRDDEHSHMTIYGNVMPMARGPTRPGEWNSYVIKADGYMIHVWENGELVQSANTRFHPELRHRHLKGWIGPQDHSAWVRLCNLRISGSPGRRGAHRVVESQTAECRSEHDRADYEQRGGFEAGRHPVVRRRKDGRRGRPRRARSGRVGRPRVDYTNRADQ